MADYRIEFSRPARRNLERLNDETLQRISRAIDSLASNPRPADSRKLVDSEYDFRIRVGSYRVVYEVHDSTLTVVVQYIRHRREAYR